MTGAILDPHPDPNTAQKWFHDPWHFDNNGNIADGGIRDQSLKSEEQFTQDELQQILDKIDNSISKALKAQEKHEDPEEVTAFENEDQKHFETGFVVSENAMTQGQYQNFSEENSNNSLQIPSMETPGYDVGMTPSAG
ncbi:hypothetical protein VKT23_020207 [Stygiomarasmius scandens]|uniref:Uncharacterized protein n=1 Tax=Marasmiellus scandens TaxID=2682957 RepID=A0ABR1IMK1_9AGAR